MEKYEVLEDLGSGGSGKVLKCRSLHSGNFFAMKRFFPTEDTHLIFQRELAPLSELKHDNVIKVLTAFLDGGLMHAVFELLDHSIVDEVEMKGCGLEGPTVKEYSFQILTAVDFIHSHNIMHRDIKPDNLLVSHSGVLKLADFGSSRTSNHASNHAFNHTSNHAAAPLTRDAGTLWFRAPEMLLMDPDYNKPADVWAVGCTLVFMATGNHFLRGEITPKQIKMILSKVGPLTAIQEQQYYAQEFGALPVVLPPTDLMEKYGLSDPLLAQLVEMCLQMDPVDRWGCSALLRNPYFTQDHFHERFPKELQKMVDQDQSVALMVEQELFPPITTWENILEHNNSPAVEKEDHEKCCCLPTCEHLRELWKDITEALWRTIGKGWGLLR